MLGKLPLDQKQHSLLENNLIQILNLKHPLIKLANQLPWSKIETDLAHL